MFVRKFILSIYFSDWLDNIRSFKLRASVKQLPRFVFKTTKIIELKFYSLYMMLSLNLKLFAASANEKKIP